MKDKFQEIIKKATIDIENVQSFHELNNLKSRFTGKKSEIKDFMKYLSSMTPEERPAFGKMVNDTLEEIGKLLEEAEQRLQENDYEKTIKSSQFDYTMPGRPVLRGGKHPLTLVQEQIEDVMISMGFQVAEGFDIEDDYHNFDALNTPKDHPSRNLADTFYVVKNHDEDLLLRTHTSPAQIRVMEKYKPPIKIISPGRAYRNDKFDPTHSPVFHQCEGLVVDEGISFKDLRDTIDILLKKMFGKGCKSRFRPHFFPFTEPSAEVDVSCFNCAGKGCSTCKNSGWIELFGAGMVHPNVFDMVGIDSEKYTGFAFGCGIDRIAMLKFHIPDIRMLFENDIRFLQQFTFSR
ncbi:MAG: phenylalanine--tRNA ligase subunit alpha [Candidatus Cloacimonetes bacterium]|nr:phenylalanine--tRNA ligase subunit alpha [Candidatus Cloacimonadota bacterium]